MRTHTTIESVPRTEFFSVIRLGFSALPATASARFLDGAKQPYGLVLFSIEGRLWFHLLSFVSFAFSTPFAFAEKNSASGFLFNAFKPETTAAAFNSAPA